MNIYEQLNKINDAESLSEKYNVKNVKELKKLQEDQEQHQTPVGYKVTYTTPGSWYSKYYYFDDYADLNECLSDAVSFINRWMYTHEHPRGSWYSISSSIELMPLFAGKREGKSKLKIVYIMYPTSGFTENGDFTFNLFGRPKTYKILLNTTLTDCSIVTEKSSPRLLLNIAPEEVFDVPGIDYNDKKSEVESAINDMKYVQYRYDPDGYSYGEERY